MLLSTYAVPVQVARFPALSVAESVTACSPSGRARVSTGNCEPVLVGQGAARLKSHGFWSEGLREPAA